MFDINELFNEFNTNTIIVSDFGIIVNGAELTHVHRTDDGNVQLWAGNPDTDKFAEELIVSKERKREILEEILDNM